ncbi:phage integrase N-terminal SAM-like domain-containing protein [Aliifodinibius salicampi]|uniref:Phage integrase N-terminal SAM-like domain-containing protein n=1 Tax=Fodinibius salicampi TaxID=1920655 RepID=A0ABT3PVI0_9BACT|nr:site-specific integrase [Fodinibius salicampi]MCW9711838.1 phage integrase N-terminal SAM-like domain-containing protein [Fodinibius salicampi]
MAKSVLLNKMRTEIRRQNYSYRTEQAYTKWIVRFVRYHQLKHPLSMGEEEVETYLNYLANERKVSAATQNEALSAILFLYEKVLKRPLGEGMEFRNILNSQKGLGIFNQGAK